MKHRVLAILLAAALLIPASGSSLAAGKLGGASGGVERFGRSTSSDESAREIDDGKGGVWSVLPSSLA